MVDQITANSLSSKFGMYEMEKAAATIINICRSLDRLSFVSIDDFVTREEKVGFIELIYNDWLLHHDHYHATFIPSDSFIRRVAPLLPLEWCGTQGILRFSPSPSGTLSPSTSGTPTWSLSMTASPTLENKGEE